MEHKRRIKMALSILLALAVIFAANASSLLQLTRAISFDEEEEEDSYIWIEPDTDPYSYPYTNPSSEPYSEPSPGSDIYTPPSTEREPLWWDDTTQGTVPTNPPSTQQPTNPPSTEPTAPPSTDEPDEPDEPYVPYTPPMTRTPVQNTTRATMQPSTVSSTAPVPETTTAPPILSPIKQYAAVQEFLTDTQLDDQTISSAGKDENAVHIGGGNAIINNTILSRKNNASAAGEDSLHYGVGSVVLATNGVGFISKSTMHSEATAATGAFSFGNSKLYLADSVISTMFNNAHGIETAESGSLYAWNMTVNTAGDEASPIYSGPGGGTMVLNGGLYSSAGLKSPTVFCAADIGLTKAELSAEQSEAAVIENTGTLTVIDSNFTSDPKQSAEHSQQWTVLLYQPGNKTDHTANFRMKNGTITSKNGGLFYSTNTTSNIYLENVTLKPYKNSEFLIRCTGNSDEARWGERGKNGSVCNLTASNQELLGNVVWDAISEVSVYVKDNSTLNGAFVKDETVKRGPGFADLYIDKGCTWTVGGDSELTNLYNAGSIADTSGNTVTIKKADGTIITEGTSAYTVIVTSYSDKADMSGAQKTPDWSAATEVARPAALGASLSEITTETPTEPSTTPALPDASNEHRKLLAIYMLAGVGGLLVIAAGIWFYQKNKYKLKKRLNNDE